MITRRVSFPHSRLVSVLLDHGVQQTFCSSSCSKEILCEKIENALQQNQLSEAWEVFTHFKTLHGFPTNNSIITKLISQSCYSPCDSLLLAKGYELVVLIYNKKKLNLLLQYDDDTLSKLGVCLARSQMPTQASTVLGIMLDLRRNFPPPLDFWRTVFLHMLKTDIGTYLASDILVILCDGFKSIKPAHTFLFNLVLDACVRFRSSLKGEQVVELMASLGIVADATTVLLIAQIYGMNGLKDEVIKLKHFVSPRLRHHYLRFYDSLLSLFLKYEDIDSAAQLVLDMCKHHGPSDNKYLSKSFLHTIGSSNLRTGLRLQIAPQLLQTDFLLSLGTHPQLLTYIHGRLLPSNKALAKIIHGFHRHGRIGELSKLLVCIHKHLGNTCLISDVLGACIQICWLETAHDILDDMELNGSPMDIYSYSSLLRAYCKHNMLKEAMVLIQQIRRRGWLQDLLDEDVLSNCLLGKLHVLVLDQKSALLVEKSRLAMSLVREMSKGEKLMSLPVYEINSSIYFFCKANMMDDAWKTYQRMQHRNIQPTVQTFASLINGYSKLKMYRDVTILWGEIRRKMDSGDLSPNRDLHEMLLSCFIRGGYFERVLEIMDYMKINGMYIDKWKCKREFMKFHKYLYKSLKEENAKTEAQRKRIEHVHAFRKYVSLD